MNSFFIRSSFSLVGLVLLTAACCAPARMAAAQPVGLGLAQANNCVACHQVDRKVVGPAFSAIAERFAGQPEAVDALVHGILNGSRNKWGPVPMPRQVHVDPDEARALAQWILSLYKHRGDSPDSPLANNRESK